MQARAQLVAIVGAAILLFAVLELVRRRRLMERYAIGVYYPPNALFFIAIGLIVLLLLHFSSVVSRLGHQSEMLAQRLALLDERLRRQEQLLGLTEPELADGERELERVSAD
jgi:hypothetical protein